MKSANDYHAGDPQCHPFGEARHRSIDPTALASSYLLGISGVVPRPIAFVSTQSASGIGNLAPFSYFNIVAHDPPTVVVGICRNRDGSLKDTLRNIDETNEFVVNIISKWMVDAANHTRFTATHFFVLFLLYLYLIQI